jgi:anti-sigma B factor antagonist
MSFPVKQNTEKNIQVIEISERLTQQNSEQLRTQLKNMVEENKYRLVLDMIATKYIDSTGLSAVVSRIAHLRSNDGDIRLAIQSDFVKELFEITNLNKIIQIFYSVEDAVASYE